MEADLLDNPEGLLSALRDPGKREMVATGALLRSIRAQVLELRKARNLTQTELAQLMGTKQPKISEIEAGSDEDANWEFSTLIRIAHALEVRLKVSFETFGSLTKIDWTAPRPPESDPALLSVRGEPAEERLRLELQDVEYRREYAEMAAYTDLATQLLALRRQRGITQDEWSERSGVTQKVLSGLENPSDGPEPPNWELATLRRAGYALDVRLQVAFISFGTLIDDLTAVTSDSLRRPDPPSDPTLYALDEPPMPDAEAPERTRWMQELVIPWLFQEERLAVGELLRWLQGKGLPPVGHDEEPYRWILRGIPLQLRSPKYERKFAERLAVILSEEPDVEPVVREQDDSFLSSLYWTCAGLNFPGILAEPLWKAYKRLEETKLTGSVRDALQAAIVQNQLGDKAFKEIWTPMIETGRHRWLRGGEVLGYEGVLVRFKYDPQRRYEPVVKALDVLVGRWAGTEDDVRTLRQLMSRTSSLGRPGWVQLRSLAENWPAWTKLAFPRIEQVTTPQKTVIKLEIYGGLLTVSQQFEQPAMIHWRGESRETQFPPKTLRQLKNCVVESILENEPSGLAHLFAMQELFWSQTAI